MSERYPGLPEGSRLGLLLWEASPEPVEREIISDDDEEGGGMAGLFGAEESDDDDEQMNIEIDRQMP
jgi:hypothetical protein